MDVPVLLAPAQNVNVFLGLVEAVVRGSFLRISLIDPYSTLN